ncbi:hypothetical protein LTR15_005549 [Elasticomyces elasticus]|nr:hypothetical protein LTR15_005549 [Elasticomyces elasticus]
MAATAPTTTAIPLHVPPPAQSGGPPAPTPPASNALLPANAAAPAPNNNVNNVGNSPAIPLAPEPPKRISSKFSASKWFMIALGVVGTVATLYFGLVTFRLARWSAGNDLYGSCVDARSINISSAVCDDILSKPPAPLPALAKRTLVKAYIARTDIALTIAVTITAGMALLVARYTLFRRPLEVRPLPVIPLHQKLPRKYSTNAAILQYWRKHTWSPDTWNDSDAEEASGSSDDEQTIEGDVGSHTVPNDTASIYMVVRDVNDPNSNIEELKANSTTRNGIMADDFDSDESRCLMRSKVAPKPLERWDSSNAAYDLSPNKAGSSSFNTTGTTPDVPSQIPRWCRAQYSWAGETEKDLSFEEGDLIEAFNAGDGLWWEGRLLLADHVGPFPSNFVEVLDQSFRPSSEMMLKAWFNCDTRVVLLMPPGGSLSGDGLKYNTQDQNSEGLDIEYQDKEDGKYYRSEDNDDLELALRRNEKLSLGVRAARS